MKTILALCIVVILVSSVLSADILDCGSTEATPGIIKISGCETTDKYCPLKRGTMAKLKFSFTTNDLGGKTNSTTVTAHVHGIIAGAPVPFPLPNPDGCKDSGLVCPIEPQNEYTYVSELEVKQQYPLLKLTVKWELRDDENKNIVCLLIPAQIVN